MINKNSYLMGIDIGSTTVKITVFDHEHTLIFSDYERHFSTISKTLLSLVTKSYDALGDVQVQAVITGSGGLDLSKHLEIPFVQEVISVSTALQELAPKTDVAIELGGEDAKIIYFEGGNVEQRMNGICAGGTGSFIDQMATLLQTDAIGLNAYAKNYKSLYTIAARCGVFAKTDIQPLINEGATKEDLAASIFQAVVNQTISGLACGKPIRGNVAFLGGPLHFLDQLKAAFVRTLHLDEEHIIDDENSHLYAAIGAAFNASSDSVYALADLVKKLAPENKMQIITERFAPLFTSQQEYDDFTKRHQTHSVKKAELATYNGNCYLGIDAGSTTAKVALVDEDGALLYSFYNNNNGNPLQTVITALQEIYVALPAGATIVRSCSTGYGEALMKAAFMLDDGEVETVTHYYAASFFDPSVDCILDIGGQDMKCIKIKDQVVDSVLLNEACSSGCGSFIETFAHSLNHTIKDFAHAALFAKNPVDLGTRCTVFMNSKIKQVQREGAEVADISAGLAHSVIKNALFKVINISDVAELGKHIVVQGGTFYNDAVLRSLEQITNSEVVRPDIAGIMGAFGAALIARERYNESFQTTMLTSEQIDQLEFKTTMSKCNVCSNSCRLTLNIFTGNRRYISGNRCERGIGQTKNKNNVPNLFEYRLNRMFDYESLPLNEATRGKIGIPKVLNLFENYPFWHTFFTELKYHVVVSPNSNHEIYTLGIETIPSESECYPAKLVHGHIAWLIEHGITNIFYPCIFYEQKEFKEANDQYNCPIVTSYPENIKNNMDEIIHGNVHFSSPFMSLANLEIVTKTLIQEFPNIPSNDIALAAKKAWLEMKTARTDIQRKGDEVIAYLKESGKRGIVLAGRPYHVDPEINHGIPELITSYDIAVLTEDSVAHLVPPERPLVVADQWVYHSRLYAAASYVKTVDNLDLIQLNSFGCGLDAITTDQVRDIITKSGKIYTCLKIDEVNNLSAARIRVRSLLSAIKEREKKQQTRIPHIPTAKKASFTTEMKDSYTIIAPQMAPIHFDILEAAFQAEGYNFHVMQNDNKQAVDFGLKYVNNDACYPSIIVVGQIMDAVLSGNYDTDKLAVMISQTGGGCRATNYIGFIRRALEKAGYSHIPVISLNIGSLESNPGFSLTKTLLLNGTYCLIFGDLLMRCVYRMRPYEIEAGAVDKLHKEWTERCREFIFSRRLNLFTFYKLCTAIVKDFDNVPITTTRKPRVGIVGEILVKFLPTANNNLVSLLEQEGAEAVCSDLLDFMLYCFHSETYNANNLGTSKKAAFFSRIAIKLLGVLRYAYTKALKKSKHFDAPTPIATLANYAKGLVSMGNQSGEGWLLTGEMLELIQSGTPNIVCVQPFGCLPNHVMGKGVIKAIRSLYPESNIAAIDYDPGASEANQLNRIKLMLSVAHKGMSTKKNTG